MAEFTIDDIPQDELDALAARARRHGRTPEEEVRHLIHEAAAEEQLVQQLEQTARAEEEVRTAETALAAESAPVTAAPRRRYRRHEPTPRRR